MGLSRRDFLKLSGAAGVAGAAFCLGIDPGPIKAYASGLAISTAKVTTTICPYCAVGCGLIVHTDQKTGRIINTEGDPDHPINEGSLCAKGAGLYQMTVNPKRMNQVLYRAPYSDKWQVKDWDWALDRIAEKVKKNRDASFTLKNGHGQVVNRTTGIAHVGSAALDNEECWLLQAIMRSLGLVYIEHQARICHSSTVAALAESFGRGAMTNHWIDIRNSDCILVMGSNAAENHPVSFKWVTKAMENGATLISVDPRFTRTSAKADIYAPLRSGTDIAFLGGMMNYILSNGKIHTEYLANYTNASFIVGSGYDFHDGLFSGYDSRGKNYDKSAWAFALDDKGMPLRDFSLKDPRCVHQLMKKHYARYTLDKVSAVTGTTIEDLIRVYKAFAATGSPEKTGTIMYAMGWTQHTVGVQNIRLMAMIQLVLGNIGRPGGGVNALRGESNVQGSTDHCLLFNIWPGYLDIPKASLATLAEYDQKNTPKTNDPLSANWWQNKPKYVASFLKAMFGDRATPQNEFGYSWLPKIDDGVTYSWLDIFDAMYKGSVKGFFAWGQNPACSGANANKVRQAMAKLDWLVNVNIFDNETCEFWRGPGMDPQKVGTEVFFLPCATSVEKEGSITNSGRWMQWRYQAVEPLAGTKPDGQIMVELFEKIRALYSKGGAFPEPIVNLRWEFARHGKFDPIAVAKLINGYFEKDATIKGRSFKKGELVPSFAFLAADGSTSSGNWLYCQSFTEKGNMAARREKADPTGMGLYPGWAWAWPVNRRIIYNRASVDLMGRPWSPSKNILEWREGKWVGDVPDGGWPPMKVDPRKTKRPFIMKPDGVASVFGPGRAEGPFPEHYEPLECPVEKNLFSGQLNNPAAVAYTSKADYLCTCDPRFPFVATTYRVAEHWQTGVLTRWQPWLLEAEPRMFVEISKELASMQCINNGDLCLVSSGRGRVEAVAMVTARFRPFKIHGNVVHQVGLPWCYGWVHPQNGGDSANLLTPGAGDPNTRIPETKAFMVNVERKGA